MRWPVIPNTFFQKNAKIKIVFSSVNDRNNIRLSSYFACTQVFGVNKTMVTLLLNGNSKNHQNHQKQKSGFEKTEKRPKIKFISSVRDGNCMNR